MPKKLEVNSTTDLNQWELGKSVNSGGGATSNSTASVVVSSGGFRSNPTVTRAADTNPYTANDVYGASFELTNIGASGGFIILSGVKITFNLSVLPVGMAGFTLFLYVATPPSAVVDNGAFSIPVVDRATLITPDGIDLTSARMGLGGGTVVLNAPNINEQFKLATGSTSLFGYLVTRGGFTPANASETASLVALSLGV